MDLGSSFQWIKNFRSGFKCWILQETGKVWYRERKTRVIESRRMLVGGAGAIRKKRSERNQNSFLCLIQHVFTDIEAWLLHSF